MRWRPMTVLLILATLIHSEAYADERTPAADRVVRLTLPLETGPVTGVISGYDTLAFTLTAEQGTRHRVLWSAIPAANVDRYWRFLERPEGDGDALLELGGLLVRHREGAELAETAFAQALALDPGLADAVQRARDGVEPDGGPRFIGDADPAMWGPLTDEVMEQSSNELRAYSERVQRELNIPLKLYEAGRFLILTDTDADQVQSLVNKLTEAYRTTAELLGDDPDGNLFRGHCLVLLFDKRVDYMRFQRDLHDTDARGTGGLCHGFGDGHVHVAAFKRNNPRQTNHIVVHEFVHAYLHRYRTPVPVADWLNEGLAEHIAHAVEPPPGNQTLMLKAKLALIGQQGLGDGFYEGENLKRWQYDVAGALTGFLLERSETAYPQLLRQVKDGVDPAQAVEAVYRMEPRVLTQRFKRRLDREVNQRFGQ